VSWAVVSYAFAVGMAATVNPCGAAMLPAYLTWFTRPDRASPAARVPRAVLAGLAVTAGFVVVFGTVGAVVSAGLSAVMAATPYVGIAVGAVLVAIGVLTVAGRNVSVQLPGSKRSLGGHGRGVRAMIGFGISYGLASLGCALPVFLAGVTVAFAHHGVASGVGAFVAYALGMGVVLTALAVVVAVVPQARLRSLRAASGRLQRPAGVLLVLVGAYIVYYWVVGGVLSTQTGSGLISIVDRLTARVGAVMNARLGVELAVLVALAAVAALAVGRRRRDSDRTGGGPERAPTSPTAVTGPDRSATPTPGGAVRARRSHLRRAWPFAAVGVAAALLEAAILGGLFAPDFASSPDAAAQPAAQAQPVSPDLARMIGLDWLPPDQQPIPAPFTLTDQHYRAMSLASLRGKAVILSFDDNHCQSLCPLYAQDVRAAIADLGPLASRVAFVGVNVNPYYPNVASDRAFDAAHGLAGLAEWHFLTGPLPTLKTVWNAYGEQPLVDPGRTVTHDTSLRFITPAGKIRGVGLYDTSAADSTRWGYALAAIAEHLLGAHTPLAARPSLAPPPPTPAATAPGFSLPGAAATDPAPVSLAALRGRPVVVNFFASWCTACQAEAAVIQAAARRYAGHVAFVGVDVNDSQPSVRAYIARYHLSYTVGFDQSGSVAAAYGVTGLPTTVFVSPSGQIVARHLGRISPSGLDHQLAQMRTQTPGG
jgi:cytochrome c biogenesis protein CcdA/cytochrome oxidase Cu insertion factor (SCO1/SenC/PrrC family)